MNNNYKTVLYGRWHCGAALRAMHVYDVRPRKDKRGVNLISDRLPFGRLWYGGLKRERERCRLREILQPVSRCRDSRV